MDYDLVVIGGGAGGLGAARAGARRGAHTLLVQQGPIGGECTFTGCVPSKALIEAAAGGVPFGAAMALVRDAIATVPATETDEVLAGEGVEVTHGWARLRSRREVDVDGRRVSAAKIIIATGGGPTVPAIAGLGDIDVLTNENVFDLDALPRTLAVLGGGAIGCELAQALSRLGADVTVVEALGRLLPREDAHAAAVLARVFAAEGIAVRTGSHVEKVQRAEHGVRLWLDDGGALEAERVLVAIGRSPATGGLGLEVAGIALDERGFVRVDSHLRTTAPGVFAVGDVTGLALFTHAAHEMGRIAAGNALRRFPQRRFRPELIPRVIYTDPEIAQVGVTEDDAANSARVSFVPMSEVDRAIAAGRTEGFVKLVAGARRGLRHVAGGRVAGATVVGPRAGEVLHEFVLAMRVGMFPARLALTVHAYPTWSTAVQQAAAQLFVEVNGRRWRRPTPGVPSP
jgi:pyruvate/2-oxoglutarate dehydrogenase complex dihydrolipoamide dehydrogenase (E3) component